MKPKYALSIRQPWAWLIVNGYKDIENRNWRTSVRGRIYIHAGKGMTRDEWAMCQATVEEINPRIVLPLPDELERGGIVGVVDVTGCVEESDSPWFFGEFGFTLANAKPLPFTVCRGELGFFKPSVEVEGCHDA